MNCSVCDLSLDPEWKYCPACGYDVKVRADGKSKPDPPESFAPPPKSKYGDGVRAQVFEVIVRQAMAGAPWRSICAGPMRINNITADEVVEECRRRQGNITGMHGVPDQKSGEQKQDSPAKPTVTPITDPPRNDKDVVIGGWNATAAIDFCKASIANPDQSGAGWGQPNPTPPKVLQPNPGPVTGPGWSATDANIDKLFSSGLEGAAMSGIPSNTPSRRLDKVKSAVQGLVNGDENDVDVLKKVLEEVLRELDAAMSSIQQQQQVLDEVEREAELRRDLDRELRRTNQQFGQNNDPGKHFFT